MILCRLVKIRLARRIADFADINRIDKASSVAYVFKLLASSIRQVAFGRRYRTTEPRRIRSLTVFVAHLENAFDTRASTRGEQEHDR